MKGMDGKQFAKDAVTKPNFTNLLQTLGFEVGGHGTSPKREITRFFHG